MLVKGLPGKDMPMKGEGGFYAKYKVSKTISHKLDAGGYEEAGALGDIKITDLQELGFLKGHISTLQVYVREWQADSAKGA
ncbi:hypothetical protein C8J56DRAFT_389640 [Mycena floridula]|nr:hypothetical protein C8J56DRAFT_389640 [Mycena floridula]